MSGQAILVARWIRYSTLVVTVGLLVAIGLAFSPTLFGREVMVITSPSMEPWAPVGSIVVTRMVDARTAGVGDVITFREEGQMPTTHRIVEVVSRDGETSTFRTKGDNNEDADPNPVTISGKVAVAERAIPFVGRILAAVRSPLSFLALVLLGLANAALERSVAILNRPRVRPMLT